MYRILPDIFGKSSSTVLFNRRYPSGSYRSESKSLCCQVAKTGDPTIPDEDASAGNLLYAYGAGLPKRIRPEEYSCY
jgi:hypothetical protein